MMICAQSAAAEMPGDGRSSKPTLFHRQSMRPYAESHHDDRHAIPVPWCHASFAHSQTPYILMTSSMPCRGVGRLILAMPNRHCPQLCRTTRLYTFKAMGAPIWGALFIEFQGGQHAQNYYLDSLKTLQLHSPHKRAKTQFGITYVGKARAALQFFSGARE